MRFVHITDMHITADEQPLYGLSPRGRLQSAIDCINEDFPDTAFVMMTGDLVNRGTVEEYRALKEIVASINAPHYMLLGNHDRRAAYREVFPAAPTDDNGFVQFTFTVEDKHFIVLDSLDEGKTDGLLCQQRLDWLSDRLAQFQNGGEGEGGGGEIFLFLHHPPLRLAGGETLAKMIFGKVRHLFFGHLHRPMHGSWQGIPMSSQFSTLHQFVYNHTTKVMLGCHEPPTFGAVNLLNGNVVINPHQFLEESARFNLRSKAAMNAPTPEDLPAFE
ncbi:MAG: phosphodiesterase [Alphaproteobacteria bacterium]|jgi:3',5'-cyclic AMP phosphodiesterase CpdA